MACDTMLSYGSWKRYGNMKRYCNPTKSTLICTSGEHSDAQKVFDLVETRVKNSRVEGVCEEWTPNAIFSFLNRVYYERRCKMDPLWNSVVVGGFNKSRNVPFLGYVDLQGTKFEDNVVTTGFASYFAIPKIRETIDNEGVANIDENRARELLLDAMGILYGRECQASGEVQIAKVTAEGTTIDEPVRVTPNWDIGFYHKHTSEMSLTASTW